eukprot:COSAG01_NODE_5881_length_3971_cov_6.184353_3_plen_85_part_00
MERNGVRVVPYTTGAQLSFETRRGQQLDQQSDTAAVASRLPASDTPFALYPTGPPLTLPALRAPETCRRLLGSRSKPAGHTQDP